MHFCTAYVAIGNDDGQRAHRHEFSPVSLPEIDLLRFLHGESAVTDIIPFVRVEQTPREERERLVSIYGEKVVEGVYPGRNPQMEMELPEVALKDGVAWYNPITGRSTMTTVSRGSALERGSVRRQDATLGAP
jgi:hypothetical protein